MHRRLEPRRLGYFADRRACTRGRWLKLPLNRCTLGPEKSGRCEKEHKTRFRRRDIQSRKHHGIKALAFSSNCNAVLSERGARCVGGVADSGCAASFIEVQMKLGRRSSLKNTTSIVSSLGDSSIISFRFVSFDGLRALDSICQLRIRGEQLSHEVFHPSF